MALIDSAQPYQVTIRRISSRDGFLSVTYSADSSYADSNTPNFVANLNLGPANFTDSNIQTLLKSTAINAFKAWDKLATATQELDSTGFNDSGYADTVYNFTYKPTVLGTIPEYNPLTHKVVAYDSEGPDQITNVFQKIALTDNEKKSYRNQFYITREALYNHLRVNDHLVKVHRKLGSGDDVSASWDASAGASFNWDSHQIASYGVSTVERVDTGTYRVVFADAYDDANYTVTTGVGAQNYDGTVASPRQLTVISRAADSLQVHCERTDDAVDEDNAYMAVQLSKPGSYDSAEIDFISSINLSFGGPALRRIKTILGYSADSAGDSDFLTYLTS